MLLVDIGGHIGCLSVYQLVKEQVGDRSNSILKVEL